MRILNRQQFLALEGEVLFVKVRGDNPPYAPYSIKVGNSGTNDWIEDNTGPVEAVAVEEDEDIMSKYFDMVHDPRMSLSMNFDYTGRDGCFDGDEVKFLILETKDLDQYLERLHVARARSGDDPLDPEELENRALQWELDWVNSNCHYYTSPEHAQAVMVNIANRYKMKRLEREIARLKAK